MLVLPHFFGLNGVWAALPTADLASSLLTGFCLFLELRHLRDRHALENRDRVGGHSRRRLANCRRRLQSPMAGNRAAIGVLESPPAIQNRPTISASARVPSCGA